jgi:hypothetical protein
VYVLVIEKTNDTKTYKISESKSHKKKEKKKKKKYCWWSGSGGRAPG